MPLLPEIRICTNSHLKLAFGDIIGELMKLLVTGGCGFIGSYFVKYYLERHPQDKIVNLDKLTYAGRTENLKELKGNKNYKFIKGDICNPKSVAKAMNEVDRVVHFAAESHVDHGNRGTARRSQKTGN